jgi:hypothetical protein
VSASRTASTLTVADLLASAAPRARPRSQLETRSAVSTPQRRHSSVTAQASVRAKARPRSKSAKAPRVRALQSASVAGSGHAGQGVPQTAVAASSAAAGGALVRKGALSFTPLSDFNGDGALDAVRPTSAVSPNRDKGGIDVPDMRFLDGVHLVASDPVGADVAPPAPTVQRRKRRKSRAGRGGAAATAAEQAPHRGKQSTTRSSSVSAGSAAGSRLRRHPPHGDDGLLSAWSHVTSFPLLYMAPAPPSLPPPLASTSTSTSARGPAAGRAAAPAAGSGAASAGGGTRATAAAPRSGARTRSKNSAAARGTASNATSPTRPQPSIKASSPQRSVGTTNAALRKVVGVLDAMPDYSAMLVETAAYARPRQPSSASSRAQQMQQPQAATPEWRPVGPALAVTAASSATTATAAPQRRRGHTVTPVWS